MRLASLPCQFAPREPRPPISEENGHSREFPLSGLKYVAVLERHSPPSRVRWLYVQQGLA